MKKKLNLLWNLKFNFFSVAERPLTFFAYFLNAKKVGRRRLVIVPATAGGLPLFPHAASAFTPALAPVRSHFACGETGLAGHRPHRGRRFAVPVTAAPRRGPNGKTPALPPFRLRTSSFSAHFSAQKCPRRAMLSHSSRRGRPFAVFHRAGAAFGTLTAAAAPPPSWSRRPLHIPCPPF